MRPGLDLLLQVGLWSLAPILDETGIHDSPSLIVMPLSAALAALASRTWRAGLGIPAAALAIVLAAFSAWTLSTGRETWGGALHLAAGMIPFHLLGTWLLVGLFWGPGRMRGGSRALGARPTRDPAPHDAREPR